MIRNAPHRGDLARRTVSSVEGRTVYDETALGEVRGWFAESSLEPGSAGAATGSGSASLYVDHAVEVAPDDLVTMVEPDVGRWLVREVRWSPLAQRALLARL